MRCPNCGAEMPVGSLYCEQCGEDIHIVPDFEPEVELNIEQTIIGIAEELRESGENISRDNEPEEDEKKINPKYVIIIILAVLLIVLCVCGIVGAVSVYRYNSLAFQTEKARECVANEDYDNAISYYERAMEISSDDIPLMFSLSEVYFLKNNKVEYEFWLNRIVQSEWATDEQLESAYGKLIAIYRAGQDFESINELLKTSENEHVISTFQNYLSSAPEFSVQEGYYSSTQPLKLSALGTGNIYYTTDGSVPDEESKIYASPIILDEGSHTICAYFVNEFGIASDYVTKTYHVEAEELPAPSVGAVSGEYSFPGFIEVTGDIESVYYTTDGSTPTVNSTLYTGPIPMPLGRSTFKFIKIGEVKTSAVVERTFNLVMNTDYTPQEAEKDVVAYSKQSGKIYDDEGHAIGFPFMYKYEYQYVTNINQVDDFYIFYEYKKFDDGSAQETGVKYAVNAYTGKIYELQTDATNNYILVEIDKQSAN